MKRLIAQRRLHPALCRGGIEFLHPENRRILAFVRELGEERILVVANLSRFVQYSTLDLSRYAGMAPVELFGGTTFPKITSEPYLLTLSPHAIYWFSLCTPAAALSRPATLTPGELSEIRTQRTWEWFFTDAGQPQLETALRKFLDREEVTGPVRKLRAIRVRESFAFPLRESKGYVVLVELAFDRGTPETRVLSIGFATADEAAAWEAGSEPRVLARVSGSQQGYLYDAMARPEFREVVLDFVTRGEALTGSEGSELVASHTGAFRELRGPAEEPLPSSVNTLQQAHRSIRYGNRLVLKAYRRAEEGPHPEIEFGRVAARTEPPIRTPPLAATIEYHARGREPMALAVVHGFVPNEGDAWQYTLDQLSVFFERAAAMPPPESESAPRLVGELGEAVTAPPEQARELAHGSLEFARLVGVRLGELHLALASVVEYPEFAPEPISLQYQRSVYQSLRNTLGDVVDQLQREQHRIPEHLREQAAQLITLRPALLDAFREIFETRIHATRIRIHGDCKLDQILTTGKDLVFIDFEGRPHESLGERRIKRSPFRDVAGLVRSFDYAADATLLGLISRRGKAAGVIRDEDRPRLAPWAAAWRRWVHGEFLAAYFETTASASFIPRAAQERQVLFRTMLLEKLLAELSGELRHRPDWLAIPLRGLAEAMRAE